MAAPTVPELLADLQAEHDSLDRVVAGLGRQDWLTPTPAVGWDVRDTVSHLCFFDEAAVLALTDSHRFEEDKARLMADAVAAAAASGADTPDVALGRRMADPGDLLARWRRSRSAYQETARAAHDDASAQGQPAPRVPWYGPAMSLGSFTTARIMESWAHGVDIRDALSLAPEESERLRHICHLAFGARAYSFAVHQMEDPGDPVLLQAISPDGRIWAWGPADANDRIEGTALDVALVFTQRRHRDHSGLKVHGPAADQWLSIAQAFAGPATVTRPDR